MRTTRWAALAVAATVGAAALPAPASAEPETFTATVLRNSDVRQAGSRTWPLTFTVQSWTSEDEIARLDAIVKEGGPDALLREFQKGKMQAGYVMSPAMTREPSWRVAVATTTDTPRGRVVRLVTDRPVGLAERWSGARSLDYEFAVFEFTLDAKGRGQGIAIPAARLVPGDDESLVFETLPYTTGPDRLMGVRTWGGEKKTD
jgi:hypothetical protein